MLNHCTKLAMRKVKENEVLQYGLEPAQLLKPLLSTDNLPEMMVVGAEELQSRNPKYQRLKFDDNVGLMHT